jgi:hypothetical protein
MKTLRMSTLVLGALALAGLAFSGCLNDSGSRSGSGDANLAISMKVSDMDNVPKKGALGKGSVIKLKKLVITMTSNVAADAVIRDTIFASDTVGSRFVSSTTDSQTFTKAYAIKPLRNWSVVIKTLDTRDSVIHRDSVEAKSLLVGETRTIGLDLQARFVTYAVKFTVPDSLRSNVSQQAQKIFITRFVMKIDSTVAIDSSRPAGFATHPVVHTSIFDYIPVNTTPDVTIRFYGHSAGTNDTLLFEAVIPDVDPEGPEPLVNAIYVGPGANGSGGAIANLNIKIGKVNTIVFNTDVNGNITWKAAAK